MAARQRWSPGDAVWLPDKDPGRFELAGCGDPEHHCFGGNAPLIVIIVSIVFIIHIIIIVTITIIIITIIIIIINIIIIAIGVYNIYIYICFLLLT